mgnify:CR=1 FL=1|jgi:hypothetical protein
MAFRSIPSQGFGQRLAYGRRPRVAYNPSREEPSVGDPAQTRSASEPGGGGPAEARRWSDPERQRQLELRDQRRGISDQLYGGGGGEYHKYRTMEDDQLMTLLGELSENTQAQGDWLSGTRMGYSSRSGGRTHGGAGQYNAEQQLRGLYEHAQGRGLEAEMPDWLIEDRWRGFKPRHSSAKRWFHKGRLSG